MSGSQPADRRGRSPRLCRQPTAVHLASLRCSATSMSTSRTHAGSLPGRHSGKHCAGLALQAEAPLPPGLDLSRLIETRLRRRHKTWLTAASVLLALALGGAGGWLLRLPFAPDRDTRALALLEQQGLATHAVFAADKWHPVEVSAVEHDRLTQWLSHRLNRKVALPELDALGYRLIGGRLLATERGGAAALFMYGDARGQRLSLVLRPMARGLHAARADMSAGGVHGCAWIADGLGYAVVAALPDEELDRVADRVRLELPAAS